MIDYDLYVITDRNVSGGRRHEELAALALEGGADIIQLRDKTMDGRDMLAVASAIRRMTDGTRALFIVNDRLDVAMLSGADGVHLGQSDIPLREARKMAPPGFLIGVSAGSVREALSAEAEGADYIGLGPIFRTTSKDDAGPACGLDMLRDVKESVSIPVVAIGGINTENVRDTVRNGADGIAMISAVLAAKDVTGACRDMKRMIHDARCL